MTPRDECFYYLVREMENLGIRANDKYFDGALEHVRRDGMAGLRGIEISALVWSAIARNREEDLDAAVDTYWEGE